MSRNNNRLTVDRLLAEQLGGPDKLRALIVSRYGTIQRYAQSRGYYPEQVHQTLSGTRAYPEVRDALAEDLGLPRGEVDELIGKAVA